MKKLILLLLLVSSISLAWCWLKTDCEQYAKWYCNAAVWVAHYPVVKKLWMDSEWKYARFSCVFSCADIIIVEETEDFY